ncbi:MAG: iron-containing alcohol dehydrogenase [Micromonosporaceae bacterium]|nr:iron-containing alcohol dehydrogenase [Micromonosporaceae bacterium]
MPTRPEVRYGAGAVLATPRLLAGLGARRVLLVCGARSFEASGAARMLPELARVAQVRRFSEFAPNTDAADLARGLALADEFRPDLVLGVGGGSALDLAKLLAAFAPGTDPAKLPALIRAGERVTTREPRLVLVPTTSGSGSEATHFAVVYLDDEKFSVAGDPLRPDLTILDPELSISGSRYQRATSGIDAVAQAIESLWAAGATPASRRWARQALRLLLPAIEPYVNEPADRSARAMALGSHLAGRAIDISKTTAAHALSYAITKRYGVSHGHAVALTLGQFVEAHAAAPAGRLQPGMDPAAHREAMAEILHRLGAAGGVDARRRFTGLLERLGLTPGLGEIGVRTAADRRRLAGAVNAERLGNNPVRFSGPELAALLAA